MFPYIRDHVDQIITIPDTELVEAFLDVMEKHKMVVENSGLLSVAALRHLSCQGLNVVCVLSGGNMDVITMASLVQHGLIMRGRIFTFSVLLPDRPGDVYKRQDQWRLSHLIPGPEGREARGAPPCAPAPPSPYFTV